MGKTGEAAVLTPCGPEGALPSQASHRKPTPWTCWEVFWANLQT